MSRAIAVALGGLLLLGCGEEPEVAAAQPTAAKTPEVDPALLRELLGESLRVEGDQIHADGLLIRLAFDPLVRQAGPVELQLIQSAGYRLSGIADGSPLWLLGLRDGDVLTSVDEQPILGREHELRSAYEARPSKVALGFTRGTEEHSVTLRIASGSAWRSTSEPPIVTTPRLPPRSGASAELSNGLRCTAGEPGLIGRCEIERQALIELMSAPESLARQARIVPSLRDGQAVGFKLYGIRVDSLPYRLGFKNGDLITSVNDRSLATVDAAVRVYESLASATELRLAIERRGQPTALEITIVDALSGPAASLGGDP